MELASLSLSEDNIKALRGRTLVIKYGGNAMETEALQAAFARDVCQLQRWGIQPVIVHGGGPQIGQMLKRLDIPSTFIDGLRVTCADTMEVVRMVLGGLVNQSLVALIQMSGGSAVGLTGNDAHLLDAVPMQAAAPLGHVGDVRQVNPAILQQCIAGGFIPVVAPIGLGQDGRAYNINADHAAAAIAGALKADRFMLLTNTPGVLDKSEQRLTTLSRAEVKTLIEDGTIHGGMLPKIQCALSAVEQGVDGVHIIDGRTPHALLLELFTGEGIGTRINHKNYKNKEGIQWQDSDREPASRKS
jgi:acetylglutamate kinase